MKLWMKLCLLLLVPIVLVVLSLTWGSSAALSVSELMEHIGAVFWGQYGSFQVDETMATILWQVRLPRIFLTFMVGAALAVSGTALQAIFRNPIVDPFSLGISSGAAFGAALSMLVSAASITLFAFSFGVLAVGITYLVSYSRTRTTLITIVLSGMVISGVFTAFLTVLQYMSDPYKLQAIVQWTMGNLHTASWEKVRTSSLPIVCGIAVIVLFRWRLNLLSLGDEESMAVGVNPKKMKLLMVGLATMITAASVAAVGMISLYGLIVPHITRILFGSDNRIGVFANISIGGAFLLLIDDLSRTLMPFEIPVGVFTMLLGAPLFVYLIRKNAVNWN